MATRFQTSMKTDCCMTLILINIETLAPVSVDHQLAAGCRLENLWLYTHSIIIVAQFAAPGGSGSGLMPESPLRDAECL